MILALELEESNYGMGHLFTKYDLINNSLLCIENNIIVKKKVLNIDIEKFSEILKNYVIHWNNNYVNSKIIDGRSSILKIYTDNEVIKYTFKNKFPYNYNDFLQFIMKEIDYE